MRWELKLRELLCKYCNPILRQFAFQLETKIGMLNGYTNINAYSQNDIVSRLLRMKTYLKYNPKAIVDVGASDGRWSLPTLRAFTEARLMMIEPLEEHRSVLERITREYPQAIYCQNIVGEAEQSVKFMQYGHKSSLYGNSEGNDFGTVVELQMTTLDHLVSMTHFPLPDLIKLDIEGAELRALSGAKNILRSVDVVEMEVNFFPFKKDIVLFHEIVSFMSENGFRIFDCFGVSGRPSDGMPAQAECIFIRQESSLISDYRWSEGLPWS